MYLLCHKQGGADGGFNQTIRTDITPLVVFSPGRLFFRGFNYIYNAIKMRAGKAKQRLSKVEYLSRDFF